MAGKEPFQHQRLNRFEIRPAVAGDGVRIAAMAASLSRDEGLPPPAFSARDFEKHGRGPGSAFQVLLVESVPGRQVFGYALFYRGFDVGSATLGFHLADLWVDRRYRINGAGRALMAAMAAECRKQGGRWLAWQAHHANREAIAFYDRIQARRVDSVSFDMGPREMLRLVRDQEKRRP